MTLDKPLFATTLALFTLTPPAAAQFWTEQIELDGPQQETWDHFGKCVTADGPWAAIGAYRDDLPGGILQGSVSIWLDAGGNWTFSRFLTASDAEEEDRFGQSIALERPLLAVGAIIADSPFADDTGAVYVFEYVGGPNPWPQIAKLTATDAAYDDFLGWNVDVDSTTNTVITGAIRDDNANGIDAGAAYVFVRLGSVWTQQHKFIAPVFAPDTGFGYGVSIDGDTAAVGHIDFNGDQGAVMVYERNGANWTGPYILTVPGGGSTDLGYYVSIDGDTILAGARGDAHVWVRNGPAWTYQAELDPTPATDRILTVDLEDDCAVVGRGGDFQTETGEAFVYVRHNGSWVKQQRITPSDGQINDTFATDVAVSEDMVLVGAQYGDSPSVNDCGTTYVYKLGDANPGGCDASTGSLVFCPCGNPGADDTGCDNAQGTGGVRAEFVAVNAEGDNTGRIVGTGFPPAATPTAVVIRANNFTNGAALFDGVRCVGLQGFARMAATNAVGGVSVHDLEHGAGPGLFFYQIWYRNTPGTFCTPAGSNLSNGEAASW